MEYKGKVLTVKEWFGSKKAQELGINLHEFEIFAILKESEKAVYAIVDLGADNRGYAFFRTFWIPKSVIIENHAYDDYADLIEWHKVHIDTSAGAYDFWSRELKERYAACR